MLFQSTVEDLFVSATKSKLTSVKKDSKEYVEYESFFFDGDGKPFVIRIVEIEDKPLGKNWVQLQCKHPSIAEVADLSVIQEIVKAENFKISGDVLATQVTHQAMVPTCNTIVQLMVNVQTMVIMNKFSKQQEGQNVGY